MRIVTMNIQHGLREDASIGDLVAVGREVAALNPDVVAVQEVDHRQRRSGRASQVEQLLEGLAWPREGGHYCAFFSGSARGLRLPALTGTRATGVPALGRLLDAAGPAIGGYGLALLTPHRVRRVIRRRLGAAPARLKRSASGGVLGTGWTVAVGQNRTFLAAEIDVDSRPCRVGVAHLELGQATASAQLFGAWRLLNTDWPHPAFLAGDMNLPAQTVRQVTGVPEELDASAPTFPATTPRAQIDHVLGAGPVACDAVATHRFSVGDHLGLIADFTIGS
ncbi:endonuclease/exonuclease/phosphatase family protein [Nanchangia anserum]|uniref:Endonuclease/exonuclease/phosphatase family protein n=1 Tax=Nanchangia anserum TaxID=2692125 RepID=A0A8I0KRK4_9ACTO|nr:endonuclease/exonuclease/phosphatase family protein [Nanchangia anserum]MBD3689497.1 endonuclease/exonuclease/phosphatase family protein [Nanchangia anserum]QOX81686.1 endonuclease/exonuclease/phosphatase family protein [Nanchangia anserum]